jgi:hypothetical protein
VQLQVIPGLSYLPSQSHVSSNHVYHVIDSIIQLIHCFTIISLVDYTPRDYHLSSKLEDGASYFTKESATINGEYIDQGQTSLLN